MTTIDQSTVIITGTVIDKQQRWDSLDHEDKTLFIRVEDDTGKIDCILLPSKLDEIAWSQVLAELDVGLKAEFYGKMYDGSKFEIQDYDTIEPDKWVRCDCSSSPRKIKKVKIANLIQDS